MISFSFIDLASMPGISSVLALLPESSNSAYMQSIGLEYESTLRNIAGMLLLLVGLVILHAGVVTPLQMQAKKYNEGHRFKRWMGLVFLFFTFTVYIRVVLESYLLVCLSCVLEFWKLGPNEAIAVFAFLVVFTVSFFVLWNYEGRLQTEVGDSYFKEFFSGLKPTRAARLTSAPSSFAASSAYLSSSLAS
jgi:Ca2+/Na+ antiporter